MIRDRVRGGLYASGRTGDFLFWYARARTKEKRHFERARLDLVSKLSGI
jgi:hypothetical protein